MEDLKTLVSRYGKLKGEMDSFKKQVDEDNKNIKLLMSETGVTEFESDGYVAKYSVSVSESFDEDKLLNKLQSMNFEDETTLPCIIKMKPYVDMDALENAIYNGKVNASDLADCRIRKETPRLTIKKG